MSPSRGWLLDTNVISELRKGSRGDSRVLAWAGTTAPAACYISRVTLSELRFGIELVVEPGFRAELESWLRDGVHLGFAEPILEVDEAVLLAWRRLVWEGRKANYTFAHPDALIAATALVHDLTVVTRNTTDFTRAGVELLDPWRV